MQEDLGEKWFRQGWGLGIDFNECSTENSDPFSSETYGNQFFINILSLKGKFYINISATLFS